MALPAKGWEGCVSGCTSCPLGLLGGCLGIEGRIAGLGTGLLQGTGAVSDPMSKRLPLHWHFQIITQTITKSNKQIRW